MTKQTFFFLTLFERSLFSYFVVVDVYNCVEACCATDFVFAVQTCLTEQISNLRCSRAKFDEYIRFLFLYRNIAPLQPRLSMCLCLK